MAVAAEIPMDFLSRFKKNRSRSLKL